MSEESGRRFQQHYHSVCRQRRWRTDEGDAVWPSSPEERATVARELFGLALIYGTDSSFHHVKEQIDAESLSAIPTKNAALETLKAMDDDVKAAILTLVDDVLDFDVYKFAIQLDRFDHGFLSLRFQTLDEEEYEPRPETEVEINPCGIYEMFQDAVRWKREFSMGADIGRPENPDEIDNQSAG